MFLLFVKGKQVLKTAAIHVFCICPFGKRISKSVLDFYGLPGPSGSISSLKKPYCNVIVAGKILFLAFFMCREATATGNTQNPSTFFFFFSLGPKRVFSLRSLVSSFLSSLSVAPNCYVSVCLLVEVSNGNLSCNVSFANLLCVQIC